MTTLDFELEIGPRVAGGYPVVARAPGGEAAGVLQWSWTTAELDRQLSVVEDKVLVSSAVLRRAPTGDEQPVRELGQRLFEAVIADEVRALYVASRQRARGSGRVLRLVLRVRAPELARLPWEFLFDPARQDYLGLTVPLVRYLQVLAPRQLLRVAAPLRILGMVAHPGDQHTLDAGAEQARLAAALADLVHAGLVELGWVAGQTYSDLEDALDDGPWHVFHFVGHGGYDQLADEGILALADETGRTQPVGADDISRLLAEHHAMRLVVLNACDTGRGSATDAFSSTAAALIRREIPAVVAMQFEITDWAAIRFAQTFYHHVARRRPVDDSVMRARRALRLAKKDTLEWGTPVLYLRAPDGRIFDTTLTFPDPAPAATVPVVRPPPAARPLHDPPVPSPAPSGVFHHPTAELTLWHDLAVNAVAFSPDGRRLATASDDRTAGVWDATSGRQLATATHHGVVWGVVFSPDGRRLATASIDRTARVRDATSGRQLATVTHHGWVREVVFSPDGRRLATASDDETARVWDATSGRQLAMVTHHGSVKGVAFSPDGRLLATASADNTARVWEVTSGRPLVTVTHHDWVLAVVFSPDGHRLATAGEDNTARIWDVTTGQLLVTVTHHDWVLAVVFSPDGHRLATASTDQTARIWDAGNGQQLDSLAHDGVVRGVVFSPDGHRLATASDDMTARIWVLRNYLD
ncbi:MAG: CHAT domain-containing protein [Pseudonocardiaceae bacterium]